MSITSRRVLISCAVLAGVVIICAGLIVLGGVGVYWLYPPAPQSVSIPPTAEEETIPPPVPQQDVPDLPPTSPEGETEPPTVTIPTEAAPKSELPPEVVQEMDEIQTQVIELRGLQPLEPVDRFLLTPEELRQRVMEDFLGDYSLEEAQDDALVLAAFGLLEAGFDLYDLYVELYSEQIAGFYDTETKEMYVIQGSGFNGPERLTYAHEYVHALQDQHYDIEEGLQYKDEACEEDTDYCAAIRALLEGDASLLELQWLFNYATEDDIRDIQEFYRNYESPVFESAPAFLREDFIFPYRYGQEFVEHLYERGGWATVDQAYRNPPISTEQIMHPERYPEVKPTPVTLLDLAPVLGDGWRELERNTMGEWYTYLILAEGVDENARLDPALAQQATDGWAGDTYVVYHQEETNQTTAVIRIVWKNETEAAQYSEMFQQHATIRFNVEANSNPEAWGWQSDNSYSELRINGATTTWILSPDATIAHSILEAIGSP